MKSSNSSFRSIRRFATGPVLGCRSCIRSSVHITALLLSVPAKGWARPSRLICKMPKRDKILIVDDDRSIRELLEILLKNEGLTVTSAAGAEEGLAQAKATEFDVVISDLKMPNMSGIEFLRELLETGLIRRRRGEVGTQFILLTAHAEAEAAVEALKMGAFDYILKDQNWTEELKFVVHNALENRR